MSEEIWKVYDKTENFRWGIIKWEVSNYGNVKMNGKPYECVIINSGYKKFAGVLLHVVVAELFIGPKPGPEYQVDHIDTNKLNNNVNNLRWCTCKENHNNTLTRKHISENHADFSGENNPMYGKHHNEESKQKISETHKGKPKSEEHKQKLREANIGKHHNEETKRKISEGNIGRVSPNKGKHQSEETKQKMSEAKTGEKNPCYGKKLMNNGIIQKFILETEVEIYLSQGWILGMLKKK